MTTTAAGVPSPREALALLLFASAALAVSAVDAYDRLTWYLEVLPVIVALPLLALTWRRFPLTALVYRLLLVHALILMLGGHYTYARVPLGHWIEQLLDLSRNPYDRIGHFAQGFVPAMLAREILLRRSPLRPGKWLFFLVVCVCLAISAFYELIEWWVALAQGPAAADFLGTQGDVWDTQWDMCFALIGALTALILLSRVHDRALARLASASPPGAAPRPRSFPKA